MVRGVGTSASVPGEGSEISLERRARGGATAYADGVRGYDVDGWCGDILISYIIGTRVDVWVYVVLTLSYNSAVVWQGL